MAGSLADQLKQAGFKSSDDSSKKNQGKKKPSPSEAKPAVKTHEHHHRTECDYCRKTAPDVEKYDHRNRSLSGQWLCIPCADRLCIDDSCRQTAQSDFSMRRMFARQYGRTKQF
jgi:hypothetical protein